MRRPDDSVATVADLQREVDVVEVVAEQHREPADLVERGGLHERARCSDAGALALHDEQAARPEFVAVEAEHGVVRVAVVVHVAGVLQPPVGEEQLRADHGDVVLGGGDGDHRLQEVGRDHLDVVVEQQQVGAGGVSGTEVHLLREVERPVVPHDLQAVTGHPLQGAHDVRRSDIVGDHHELEIRVRRQLDEAAHAVDHEASLHAPHPSRRAARRDDHRHQRGRLRQMAPGAVHARHGAMLDRGGDADAVAVRLDRTPAAVVGVGLRLGVASDRRRQHPPVVEDPRDVMNTAGALGHAQEQVVVLRTLEAGVEATDFVDERAPGDGQMARVHLRTEALGRPVGLVERRDQLTPGREVVLVGVAVVDLRVIVEDGGHRGERVAHDEVVVVEEGDELAGRHGEGVVRGGDDPAVLVTGDDAEATVGGAVLVEHRTYVRLRRAVVDEAVLPVGERLRADRVEAGAQHRFGRVVHRRDDREERHGGGGRVVGERTDQAAAGHRPDAGDRHTLRRKSFALRSGEIARRFRYRLWRVVRTSCDSRASTRPRRVPADSSAPIAASRAAHSSVRSLT